MRTFCLFSVIVVGACWRVGAFALDYPATTRATGRHRRVDPVEIARSEPALVA